MTLSVIIIGIGVIIGGILIYRENRTDNSTYVNRGERFFRNALAAGRKEVRRSGE